MTPLLRALLPWLLLLSCAVAVVATGPSPTSDLAQFLPRASGEQETRLLDELRDGAASRLLLLELSAGTPLALANASRHLAATLRASDHFDEVNNGDHAFAGEATERLFRHRYLLSDTPLDTATLRHALEQRLTELAAPLGMADKGHLSADPTAAFRGLLQQWRGDSRRHSRHGVWFSADGTRALLLARSRYPGFDLDRQQRLLSDIEAAFTQHQASGLRLTLTGPPRFAVNSRTLIQGEATRLSLLASLLVMGLLWLSYRSLPVVVIAALPLAGAVLLATAAVTLLFGQIHGITLAFGITLIGIAVDYPIHLFSHARHNGRTAEALASIWPTLRLGVATTLLGFAALLLSGFGGLSQLGTFAMVGISSAALLTRTLLPPLLPKLPPRPLPGLSLQPRRGVVWLPLLALLLTLPYLTLQRESLWEHDLSRLNPIGDEAKRLDRQLRHELGTTASPQLLVLRSGPVEALLQRSEALQPALERLRQGGAIERFDLPSQLLPSVATQRRRQLALPSSPSLTSALRTASAGLPFRDGLFAPLLDAVEESRTLDPLTPEGLATTPLRLPLATLLRHAAPSADSGWIGLVALHGVRDPTALAQLADRFTGVYYLDTGRAASQLVGRYRDEALHLTAVGGLVALLVLAWQLPLRRVWRVVTPVVGATLVTSALLHLLGHPLSLFHITALLLVVGIGLDYALFIERTPANAPAFSATLHALITCNLTTLLVFGLLASSAIPVLQAIGLTVAIGALLSLLFALAMVHNDPSQR